MPLAAPLASPATATTTAPAASDSHTLTIDHRFYPHIVDAIVDAAPPASLVILRATCRAFRDRCDRLIVRDIVLTPGEVTAAGGVRIPHPRWWEDPDLLENVRVATFLSGRAGESDVGHRNGGDGSDGGNVSANAPGQPSLAATPTAPATSNAALACFRAICDPWADPDILAKLQQHDSIAVRMIHDRPRRTVAISLRDLDKFHPRGNFLRDGIDKLVINFPVENYARPNPRVYRQFISHGGYGFVPRKSSMQEMVIVYPPARAALKTVDDPTLAVDHALSLLGEAFADWLDRDPDGTLRPCKPTVVGADEYPGVFPPFTPYDDIFQIFEHATDSEWAPQWASVRTMDQVFSTSTRATYRERVGDDYELEVGNDGWP